MTFSHVALDLTIQAVCVVAKFHERDQSRKKNCTSKTEPYVFHAILGNWLSGGQS